MGLTSRQKLKSLVKLCVGATVMYSGISLAKGDEHFYKDYLMPLVHLLDPEQAHKLAVFTSKHRLLPKSQFTDPEILKISFFGKEFSNPIGIAAGFDKDGSAIIGLRDMGFGFVEIGSVTPLPQPGNEKPRVFRLPEDMAIINRYGFNSEGHATVLERVQKARNNPDVPIIGVNLGKNKTSEDAVKDYVEGIKIFGEVSDYLVVNVSSPNTPNLRALQNKENLRQLLQAVVAAKNSLQVQPKPPLFLKLAPDLSFEEKKDIAEIIKRKDCQVDGLIVCNTTIERPSLKSIHKNESGGLSGAPLKDTSTQMIKEMSKLTNGAFIIGVGGVSTGKDAYEKIRAGASLVQIYSALIYGGPPLVAKIKKELAELVEKDGFKSVGEAVGIDV
ncbi:dihydroorotate dehydrogenase (quinone), mitochondrial [Anthonomus grandis grandis]|uniref:dihydroorotate dehydrogenase (quinone), mitochondrial n=1 Tax=Anthonomus grandis grandis TaxID=2921223 RepID=UPI002166A0D2|nr:dihydroorotate dehydrogenase (quinone), mitochondrial [Anthonomus grandis grandis]